MKNNRALKIKRRVRSNLIGTKVRPRLSVHRTGKHIYTQLINDESATTLESFSSARLEKKETKGKTKVEVARLVGSTIAKLALEKKIKKVIFDRGSRRYHGRVKALADAAREEGLEF